MIKHDGHYYFLKPMEDERGRVRWKVMKRPEEVDQIFRGDQLYRVNSPRAQRACAVSAEVTPYDEVLLEGLSSEEADSYLKLLR